MDAAVEQTPADPEVRFQAGDLTLSQGRQYAVVALRRYYLPALELAQRPPPEVIAQHVGLAFYVAAADQTAGNFLAEEAGIRYADTLAQIAVQRYAVFFSQDVYIAKVKALTEWNELHPNVPQPLKNLLLGDLHLSEGQVFVARRSYLDALQPDPQGITVPRWVLLEAQCNADKIQSQRAAARLMPTCVPLPELVIAK